MENINKITYPNSVAKEAHIIDRYRDVSNILKESIISEFLQITKVPRPSGYMNKIRKYILDWAKTNNVYAILDKSGCIVMKVPASEGCEDWPGVCLQCHMDMVAVANEELVKSGWDPKTYQIDAIYDKENGYIHTNERTSLGADDGQGIATILSVFKLCNVQNNVEIEDIMFASALKNMPVIKHGPIKAILTYDEETSMQGIKSLDVKHVDSKYFINLDSIYVGTVMSSAAGAFYPILSKQYQLWYTEEDCSNVYVHINNLTGGHSGEDIAKNRASAFCITLDMLNSLEKNNIKFGFRDVQVGTFMNAIPIKADFCLVVNNKDLKKVEELFNQSIAKSKTLYSDGQKIKFEMNVEDSYYDPALKNRSSLKILRLLNNIPNGVIKYLNEDDKFPETSNNVGVLSIKEGLLRIEFLYRTCVKEKLDKVIDDVTLQASQLKMDLLIKGIFPAWPKLKNSKVDKILLEGFSEACGFEGKKLDSHSGLECGYLASTLPKLEMASIGCDVEFEHTTKEKLYTSTISANIAAFLYALEHLSS